MKPEKRQLIDDLLGRPGHREATLVAGAQILRRRRHRRTAIRGFALLMLLTLGGLWLETVQRHNHPAGPTREAVPLAVAPSPVQPQALTDDELLALFPNTPVGLATLSDGRKRLIFPRPGDEQKFITRL